MKIGAKAYIIIGNEIVPGIITCIETNVVFIQTETVSYSLFISDLFLSYVEAQKCLLDDLKQQLHGNKTAH